MSECAAPVLVLNWNGWDFTLDCLKSLGAAPDVSCVWLIDNGSDLDRTAEAAAAYPGLRVLRWPENLGFAGGYNRALRVAAAEGRRFAYLLNNDAAVRAGFLSCVMNTATCDERLAAVGSCIVPADEPTNVYFDGAYHVGTAPPLKQFGVRYVPEVNGAGMLIRLAAMERVGYFDERFFCYGEESEWCDRARRAGWMIAVVSASVVVHRRRASDVDQNARYYRARNAFVALDRLTDRRRNLWRVLLSLDASDAAWLAWRGADDGWPAIGAGVKDGLRQRFGRRTTRSAPVVARLLVALGCIRALFFQPR